jgi:ABC-type antimicrobial peptide transport system permease subunit
LLCSELVAEEKAHGSLISNMEAEERIYEMIDSTKKFLHDDYNKIMDDIKQKINTYIHIAIARERMLRNKGLDIRGVVEQTLRILISSGNLSANDEIAPLFNIQKYEYVDQSSLMYPHKSQQVLHNTLSEYVELSPEEMQRQKYILEQESHNPYSKDQMKKYMDSLFSQSEKGIIDNSTFDFSDKDEILKSLAAISYAKENEYLIETDGTYIESKNFITKHWTARKK